MRVEICGTTHIKVDLLNKPPKMLQFMVIALNPLASKKP